MNVITDLFKKQPTPAALVPVSRNPVKMTLEGETELDGRERVDILVANLRAQQRGLRLTRKGNNRRNNFDMRIFHEVRQIRFSEQYERDGGTISASELFFALYPRVRNEDKRKGLEENIRKSLWVVAAAFSLLYPNHSLLLDYEKNGYHRVIGVRRPNTVEEAKAYMERLEKRRSKKIAAINTFVNNTPLLTVGKVEEALAATTGS